MLTLFQAQNFFSDYLLIIMSDTQIKTPVSNLFHIPFGFSLGSKGFLVTVRFCAYLNPLSPTHMAIVALSVFSNLV